jgi:hypothetical protein
MHRKKRPDRAYLVRCCQGGKAAPGNAAHWCFSVEEVLHERHRRGFDSLEALVAFWQTEFSGSDDEPSKD